MASVAALQHPDADRGQPATVKKHRVRVVTDKRREQNRRAQKNYREKLKRKLESLEEHFTSTSTGTEQDDQSQDLDVASTALEGGLEDLRTQHEAEVRTHVIDFGNILSAGGDLSIPTIPLASNFDIRLDAPSQSPSPVPILGTKTVTYRDDIPQGVNPRSLWGMPHRPVGAAYSPPPNASAPYMSGALTAISPNYAYERQKALIRRRSSQSASASSNAPDPQDWPSPQLNFLRLTSESNLAASLAIGLMLGISSTAYLEDHPSPFPHCTTQLFPEATLPQLTGRDFPNAPQEFREHFARIKSPLRPVAAQMYYNHPSYLDCIIFPRFRERVVQASVEGRLDHVEFFLDLMHGGLICWGSALPRVSRRKRRRDMHDQVAWSTRSWEARRWFLEKWAWLCGTEEDEEREGDLQGIWKSSRWWWAVRGELDSEDEWDEDEREGEPFGQEVKKVMRFETGIRDEEQESCMEKMWAEGGMEVKGTEEGASRFNVGGIVYPTPDLGVGCI